MGHCILISIIHHPVNRTGHSLHTVADIAPLKGRTGLAGSGINGPCKSETRFDFKS